MASERDYTALFRIAKHATLLIALIAVAILLPILFAPARIMSVFGDDFAAGASLLVILSIGQIVNALTGPVQSMLVMTGNERAHRTASLAGGIVVLGLGFTLIPRFGGVGAAWTSACGFAVTNLISLMLVRALVWRKFPAAGRTRNI